MGNLKVLFLIIVSCWFVEPAFSQDAVKLPKWEKGYLDIHTINTGRGNCQYLIFPDGTTMMIDCGDFDGEAYNNKYKPMVCAPSFPNDSLTPAKIIANYIAQLQGNFDKCIDYFFLTHFHSDHYGAVRDGLAISKGGYVCTGLTEIADYLNIKKLVDRGYPLYNFPIDLRNRKDEKGNDIDPTFINYLKFVDYNTKKGMRVEKFDISSNSQFTLLNTPEGYSDFKIQNIKANNLIWSGQGKEVKELFQKEQIVNDKNQYSENYLSCAIRLDYGNFSYYAGGDNTGLVDQDHPAWCDIESCMANVIGHVSAMSLNHHGNRDATNLKFLNTLDPKVVIMQTWSSDHPGQEVGHRLISPYVGTQKRDIFMTYYNPNTGVGIGPWFERCLKASCGHFVIRVYPDSHYDVYVMDCESPELTILKKYGPYYNSTNILDK